MSSFNITVNSSNKRYFTKGVKIYENKTIFARITRQDRFTKSRGENLVTLSYTSVGKVNLMSTVLYSTVHTVHIRLDLGLIDIRRGAQIKKYANHR